MERKWVLSVGMLASLAAASSAGADDTYYEVMSYQVVLPVLVDEDCSAVEIDEDFDSSDNSDTFGLYSATTPTGTSTSSTTAGSVTGDTISEDVGADNTLPDDIVLDPPECIDIYEDLPMSVSCSNMECACWAECAGAPEDWMCAGSQPSAMPFFDMDDWSPKLVLTLQCDPRAPTLP